MTEHTQWHRLHNTFTILDLTTHFSLGHMNGPAWTHFGVLMLAFSGKTSSYIAGRCKALWVKRGVCQLMPYTPIGNCYELSGSQLGVLRRCPECVQPLQDNLTAYNTSANFSIEDNSSTENFNV